MLGQGQSAPQELADVPEPPPDAGDEQMWRRAGVLPAESVNGPVDGLDRPRAEARGFRLPGELQHVERFFRREVEWRSSWAQLGNLNSCASVLGPDLLVDREQGATRLQDSITTLDELPGWTLLRRLDQGDVDPREDDPSAKLLLTQLPGEPPAPQLIAQPVEGRPIWVQLFERPRQSGYSSQRFVRK
jgi:hypothetical protein